MDAKRHLLYVLLIIIAVCLLKISFFSAESRTSLVPSAYADGAVVEWNNATTRMVSTGDNGATTYVWDYTGKTSVRKYSIENGKLKMVVFNLEN